MPSSPTTGVTGNLYTFSATGAPVQPTESVNPFFFPGQFAARPALACLADLAQAHGVSTDITQLARQLGLTLPGRVGAQDLVSAAEGLGFEVRLERHSPGDLPRMVLPVLLFMADGSQGLQVLTQCDGRYVVTHSHVSVVPTRSMVPLDMLVSSWAMGGLGWVLSLSLGTVNLA
jgi:ABC-type bacteriocin/lantibiotic exporter with double-glycine peptidase domain